MPHVDFRSIPVPLSFAGTNQYSPYSPRYSGPVYSALATTPPAGGVLLLGVSNALGIYGGSGAPSVSAAKGSLYLRTDGSTTNDRAYINTDGGTTWTAITTAA